MGQGDAGRTGSGAAGVETENKGWTGFVNQIMCENLYFGKIFHLQKSAGLMVSPFPHSSEISSMKIYPVLLPLFTCNAINLHPQQEDNRTLPHAGVFWHFLFHTLLTLTFVRQKPLHAHFTEEENEDRGSDALIDIKELLCRCQNTNPLFPRNTSSAAWCWGPDRTLSPPGTIFNLSFYSSLKCILLSYLSVIWRFVFSLRHTAPVSYMFWLTPFLNHGGYSEAASYWLKGLYQIKEPILKGPTAFKKIITQVIFIFILQKKYLPHKTLLSFYT